MSSHCSQISLARAIHATLVAAAGLAVAIPASAATNLEEIVVTAQKRDERLQDVPVSVSAIDSESLISAHNTGIGDYFAQVPGLAVNAQTSGRLNLSIRGITTGGTSTPTVGITIDDVPIGSSTGYTYAAALAADIDPAALERVEVLRGPQGTLYGASSLGGLLRYVTRKPRFDEFSGRIQLDGASVEDGENGFTLRGHANIPLVDEKFAMTVSAFARQDPGFVDNIQTGQDDVNSSDALGGRLDTLWQLTDNASLRVSALYQDSEGDGSSDIEADVNLDPIDGLSHTRNAGTGVYSRTLTQFDATLEIDFDWGALSSITGYGTSEFRDTIDDTAFLGFLTEIVYGPGFATTTFLPSDTDKFTQEFRLASTAGEKLEWLVGVFYTDEDSDVQYNVYATDPATGDIEEIVLGDAFPSSFKEYALFGTATWRFTENFHLQVGGRYSENEQEFDETITGPLFDPPYLVSADSDDDAFTWLVSPSFRISEDMMLYARVATGYRAGGPNPGAGFGFPSAFGPDETTSYEGGLKGLFLDGALSLDFSVYYIDWKDIQLQQRDPDTGFVYYSNAGKARSQGLELTLAAAPTERLNIAATIAYTDAELSDPTSGGIVADAGDPLPFSADLTATLSADQEFTITDNVDGFIGGTFAYVGSRYEAFPSEAGLPRIEMPSYTALDLRAGVRFSDWTVSLFARNVTDEFGILGAEPETGDASTGVYLLNIIRPRSFGLSVSKEF
jgi:outer membrane receptor protein involved in Fe transport